MTAVRWPRLLGAGFAEQSRLEPSEFSLSLPLRDVPSASMTLPNGSADILTHQWMELFTARGSAGLFRVTDIDHDTGGETSLSLRHGIDTLSDDVWPVSQYDYSGTVAGFLAALLSKQTTVRWQLGTCEDAGAYKKSGINYTKLSDLLSELINARNDYYPEYDFTTTPWTINWRALPQAVSAEFRLSRNVESATVSRSDADMCNKLYLAVNTWGTENGVSVSTATHRTFDDAASQAKYGIIARFEDVDTEGVASVDAWAAAYLAKRKEPRVQITIDGLELAALTGDTWDECDRGRMVRAILTDMGETVSERVECVSYPDVLGEPERVEVELANRLDTFTKSVSKIASTASSASYESHSVGRSSARGSQLSGVAGQANRIELVVTDVKEAVDGTGITEMYESGILIDATAGVRIYSLFQGFESQYSAINVNKDGIQNLVTKTGVNSLGQGETLYSLIDQAADHIALIVDDNGIKTASIILAINGGSGSSVAISADKILLSGSTTLNTFFSGSGYAGTINAGTLNVGTISMTAASGSFTYAGYTWNARQLKMSNVAGLSAVSVLATGTGVLNFTHAHALSVDSSGNVTCGLAVPENSASATFNMAATQFFQDAVEAARQEGAASVTLTTRYISTNGTYHASSYGYSGFSTVSVNVSPNLTTGSFTANGIYSAPSGYDGWNQITVNVPSASYSSSDLHISKSEGDVLLYLGNHVVERKAKIEITSLVKSSNSNAWNITVRIDGDTNFYFTKLPTG